MNTENHKEEIVISCLPGLGEVLKSEVESLGYVVDKTFYTSVVTSGKLEDTYVLNRWLRTASHVYFKLSSFIAENPDQLYKETRKISWENWIEADGYFSVTSHVKNKTIKDTRFPNMKLKDAVVDRFMNIKGSRPNTGADKSKVVIHLQWFDNNASVYLDTTGQTLSKRGYRLIPGDAPLAESLAAALILSSGWDQQSPFINPMCGSGTLAIEAALIAYQIPPTYLRSNFAFKHLIPFDRGEWSKVLGESIKPSLIKPKLPIFASDLRRKATSEAKKNIERSLLAHLITVETGDFTNVKLFEQSGVIMMNPPYGIRLGEEQELEELYGRIGDFLKQKCAGYTAYVFTGNLNLAKNVGLRTSFRKEFQNAKIESRLLEYQLYKGSKSD